MRDHVSHSGHLAPFHFGGAFTNLRGNPLGCLTEHLESPVCLARSTKWGFDGTQLLVLPIAGEFDNAFYHREARSLFFYYFTPAGHGAPTVYSCLSQDIVCHETTHALVDGIAPDLYDSVSPDGAAIHESIADTTASLISLGNRELISRGEKRTRLTTQTLLAGSSRFSRIAEQFGRWRGHGTELRDLNNAKTLDPAAPEVDRADATSPHSLGEVVSGALYEVLLAAAGRIAAEPATPQRLDEKPDVQAALMLPLQARLGSLMFKGLDWLPPGDAGLADYVRSILAADLWHWPEKSADRETLATAATSRQLATADELTQKTPGAAITGGIDFAAVTARIRAAKDFVRRNRELFGVPSDHAFITRVTPVARKPIETARWLRRRRFDVDLDTPDSVAVDDAELLLMKAGWWISERNDLGDGFAPERERMVGTTVAIDREANVVAILRGGHDEAQLARRASYLRRLAVTGVLLPPERSLGPDAKPLDGYLHASRASTTRIAGGFRALHLTDGAL